MATRASIGARRAIASQGIEQSIRSIAAGLGLDVPADPPPQVNRDPDLRAAAHQERVASFLAVVASRVGKPVEAAEPPAPADPAAIPPPAEGEPPHTLTVVPLQRAEPVEGEPDGEGGDHEEVDEEQPDGTKRKVRRRRSPKK